MCLVWFGVDFFGTEHVVSFCLFKRSIATKSEHVFLVQEFSNLRHSGGWLGWFVLFS